MFWRTSILGQRLTKKNLLFQKIKFVIKKWLTKLCSENLWPYNSVFKKFWKSPKKQFPSLKYFITETIFLKLMQHISFSFFQKYRKHVKHKPGENNIWKIHSNPTPNKNMFFDAIRFHHFLSNFTRTCMRNTFMAKTKFDKTNSSPTFHFVFWEKGQGNFVIIFFCLSLFVTTIINMKHETWNIFYLLLIELKYCLLF